MPRSLAGTVDARPRLTARSRSASPTSAESVERGNMPEWLLPYAGRPRASKVRVKEEWIVVAPKADTEVVDYLLKRSPVVIGRVIWTDEGPIKFYSSMGDVWRDLIETAGVAPHCPLVA